MKILIIIAAILTSSLAFASDDKNVCIKDGRQFYMQLLVGLDQMDRFRDVKRSFIELKANLPKEGHMGEFGPSLPSLIQISDVICGTYGATYSYNQQDTEAELKTELRRLNKTLLNKELSEKQLEEKYKKFEFEKDNNNAKYLMCMSIATSPDFIFVNKKCLN